MLIWGKQTFFLKQIVHEDHRARRQILLDGLLLPLSIHVVHFTVFFNIAFKKKQCAQCRWLCLVTVTHAEPVM